MRQSVSLAAGLLLPLVTGTLLAAPPTLAAEPLPLQPAWEGCRLPQRSWYATAAAAEALAKQGQALSPAPAEQGQQQVGGAAATPD